MILYSIENIAFQIDEQDYQKVKEESWRINNEGYICNRKGKLHDFLLGPAPKPLEWDHKDRNKLNNKRDNLRLVTHQINARNRNTRPDSSSGYKGVSPFLRRNQIFYRAHITVDKKFIFLGNHPTLEEAVKARKEGEEKYWLEK